MTSALAASPTLVSYPSPSEFLRAVLPYDSWHMNIAIGSATRLLPDLDEGQDKTLWLAVWTDGKLDMVLARAQPVVAFNATSHSDNLFSSWIEPRIALLADELHCLISTSATAPLTSVTGPEPLVQAFVARWETLLASRLSPEPGLDTRLARLPRNRVPPSTSSPQPLPPGHSIRLLSPDSAPDLAQMMQGFASDVGRPLDPEDALKMAAGALKQRNILAYAISSETGEDLAGFVRTGRVTLRLAAVTGVYTKAKYRRMGIAQRLTGAAVMHLLSEPHPLKEVLEPLTTEEPAVNELAMFAEVENESAQGIYRRVGFGFMDGEWEENGEKSWEHFIELKF